MIGSIVMAEPDAEAAGDLAASLMLGAIRATLALHQQAVVGLSGGSTPWPAYRRLATAELDWERVLVIQVDERRVPVDHPDRNLAGIRSALTGTGVRILALEGTVPEAEERYRSVLGERSPDLVVLGLGADGHTASLVPDDPVLEADGLVAESRPYRGHRRLTLTRSCLAAVRTRIVLAHGPDKREALARARQGQGPAGGLPGAGTLVVTTVETL